MLSSLGTHRRMTENEKMQALREEERFYVFSVHTQLIETAAQLSADQLSEEIYYLPVLDKKIRQTDPSSQDFPRVDGRSLFHAVLENKQLNDKTKSELIDDLFAIGYWYYHRELIATPLVDHLLCPEFHSLLKSLYIKNNEVISKDREIKVWESLLVDTSYKNGIQLLRGMLVKGRDSETLLKYIEFWLNKHTNKNDVDGIYQCIQRLMTEYPRSQLRAYKKTITKIAQMRILSIVKEEKEAGEDDSQIKRFLQSSEPAFFNFFKRHVSSYDVYQMMRANSPEAEEYYLQKCVREDKNINQKLANELGHPTGFTLKR